MPRAPKGVVSKRCKQIKRDGHQCQRWANHGSEYCHTHGFRERGAFKPGPLNPRWKSGKYSRCLPQRLLATYSELLNDPEYLEQREEIALLTARLAELVQELETEDSPEIWEEIRQTILDKSKLIIEETRYLKQAEAYFTAEQGIAMLMRIADAVKRHVSDEKARRAIANEIYQTMNFGGGAKNLQV